MSFYSQTFNNLFTFDLSMKACKKCGGYEKNNRGRCKPCSVAREKKWHLDNAEKERVRKQLLYRENADAIKARAAKWSKDNPEKRAEIRKRWAELNPDKRKKAEAKYRENNPEKRKESCAKWDRNNKEALRIHSHNRRVRKRENGGSLSKGLVEKLYQLQRGKCACCGVSLGDDYHLDHKIPIALGGANEDWNMQLLTATCNRKKGKKHPIQFMQERGFLL